MVTRRNTWWLPPSLALAAFALLHLAGACSAAEGVGSEPASKASGLILTPDQAIGMFQEKVRDNPDSALLHTLLGHAYIRRARDRGDLSDYERAEASIRRALDLDGTSVSAQVTLAQILCAGHKFAEGLRLAQQVYAQNPREHGVLLMVADAQLELGDYAAAEKTYEELPRKDPSAYLVSRLARLAELKGNTAEALRLMERAAREEGPASLSPEASAWYPTRLGEIQLNAGHVEEAVRQYQAALKLAPRYHVALVGLGRVRTAEGKFDEAIALYKQAVAIAADLPMLAEMGDLYAHAGNDFLARVSHDKVEKTGRGRPAYGRELALFWCDHSRNLPEALDLARKELDVRHDVHTHDVLAWALCKNGRFKEAEAAMHEALKLGTADARFFYHAGMIQHGLCNQDKARDYLKRALALNPRFSLRGADDALHTLESLDGKSGASP